MSLPKDDPFRILGVSKDATRTEVVRAYRGLALALHPDRNRDPAAEEQLARVIDAYRRLTRSPEPSAETPAPAPTARNPTLSAFRPRGPTVVAGPVRIRPLPD